MKMTVDTPTADADSVKVANTFTCTVTWDDINIEEIILSIRPIRVKPSVHCSEKTYRDARKPPRCKKNAKNSDKEDNRVKPQVSSSDKTKCRVTLDGFAHTNIDMSDRPIEINLKAKDANEADSNTLTGDSVTVDAKPQGSYNCCPSNVLELGYSMYVSAACLVC